MVAKVVPSAGPASSSSSSPPPSSSSPPPPSTSSPLGSRTFDLKKLAGNLIELLLSVSRGNSCQVAPSDPDARLECIKCSSDPFFVDNEGDAETTVCCSTSSSFASTTSSVSSPSHQFESYDTERFDFLSLMGEGSYGSVFLASYAGQQQVAVKAISKAAAADGQMDDLLRERDLLRDLDHPFVLRIFGTCQTRDELWLVSEAQECGELWAAIHDNGEERAGLPHLATQFYAGCILLALDHIHEAGIVYRDLKPENITIDIQGYPKIIDFGLARRLAPGVKCSTLVGTPDYFAPEIIFGKQGYDSSVDLWAFGVLMYEMVMGATPFTGKKKGDLTKLFTDIAQVMKSGITLSRSVDARAGYTPRCRELVTQLMSGDPGQRLGGGDGTRSLLDSAYFQSAPFTPESLCSRRHAAPLLQPRHEGVAVSAAKPVEPFTGDQSLFCDF